MFNTFIKNKKKKRLTTLKKTTRIISPKNMVYNYKQGKTDHNLNNKNYDTKIIDLPSQFIIIISCNKADINFALNTIKSIIRFHLYIDIHINFIDIDDFDKIKNIFLATYKNIFFSKQKMNKKEQNMPKTINDVILKTKKNILYLDPKLLINKSLNSLFQNILENDVFLVNSNVSYMNNKATINKNNYFKVMKHLFPREHFDMYKLNNNLVTLQLIGIRNNKNGQLFCKTFKELNENFDNSISLNICYNYFSQKNDIKFFKGSYQKYLNRDWNEDSKNALILGISCKKKYNKDYDNYVKFIDRRLNDCKELFIKRTFFDLKKFNKVTHREEFKNKTKIISLINEIGELTKTRKTTRPNFRKYYKFFTKTDDCYCSIIFLNNSYLPGILNLGYSLKKTLTKKNLVCLVQDKPYKKNNYKFPGLSIDDINCILRIYDIVYGFDLIQIKNFNYLNTPPFFNTYSNLGFYINKCLIVGLIDYKKIFFLDASSLVLKNIDKIIDNININCLKPNVEVSEFFLEGSNILLQNRFNINGQYMLIYPSLELYNTFLLLVNKYKNILNLIYSRSGIDEIIMALILFNKYQFFNTNIIQKYIINFQMLKPWKDYLKVLLLKNCRNCKDIKDNFDIWNKKAKKLLKTYPSLIKYF